MTNAMTQDVSYQELVDEILQEYPERKGKEQELRQIFDAIARIKPSEQVDENFKEHLKEKLVLLFKQHMMSQQNKPGLGSRWKYAFAGAGTMGILLIALSFLQPGLMMQRTDTSQSDEEVNMKNLPSTENDASSTRLSFGTSIKKAGAEEFGALAIVPGAGIGMGGGGGGDIGMMAPQPESVSADVENNDTTVSDDDVIDEKRMMLPYPEGPIIRYVYTYEGSLPEVPSSMEVYQIENRPQALKWSDNRFSTDLIDLDAFDELETQNLTFVEDKRNGFMVYVDLLNGNLSMYRNYEYTEERVEPTREETSYVTGEVLEAAQEFVEEYAVDISQYGEATVYEPYYYPIAYAEGGEGDTSFPAPYITTVEVKYPYELDEKGVYEQYGQVYGVSVTYDLIKDQVQGLYGIANHDLVASTYPLITDEDAIRAHLRNGGFADPYYTDDVEIDEIEVPVGNVELVYAHVYEYSTSGQPARYFVPALKFTPQRDGVEREEMERAMQMGYGYPSQNDIIVPLIGSAYDGN